MNKILSKSLLLCLIIYCFVGDFLVAVFHIQYIRVITFGMIVLLYPLYLFNARDKNLNRLTILFICISVIYYVIRQNTEWIYFFYLIPIGYIFYRERKISCKFLDYIFVSQFILILYEFITQDYLYTVVYSGILSVKVIDITESFRFLDETGFRPKGYFIGALVATSFDIYYCLLNKESKKKTFFSFIAALILNGRLAILITFIVVAHHFVKTGYSRRIRIKRVVLFSIAIIAFSTILYITVPVAKMRIDRIASSFVFNENTNNLGRIGRYIIAYNEYVNKYSIIPKMFGREYNLYDVYGRPVSPETDVIGILLEIGFVGFFIYFIALIQMLRAKKRDKEIVSVKVVAVLTLVAFIEYRHASGNARGLLFWMLYFYITQRDKILNNIFKFSR